MQEENRKTLTGDGFFFCMKMSIMKNPFSLFDFLMHSSLLKQIIAMLLPHPGKNTAKSLIALCDVKCNLYKSED